MSEAKQPFNPFDPTGMFKEARDVSMDAWAKVMVDLVNTDVYAKSTGKMLDTWLNGSAPFRKVVDNCVSQSLSSMKLPSLGDLSRVAQQVTNIEMRLDDMEAKLDELLALLKKKQ